MNHIVSYVRNSLHGLFEDKELSSLTVIIWRDILGLSLTDFYLRKDIKLSNKQQADLERTVQRLKMHEPIQYICGTVSFSGLEFRVAPGVLIPRPETGELVQLIVQENPLAVSLLDVGTGSGCIAVSLSCSLPQASVEAWDVSEDALAIARENNKTLNACVRFLERDVLSDFPLTPQYDVIVSNPPYVTEQEKEQMESNVLEWEPGLALFVPNEDPLRFYRRIAVLGRELLLPKGRLYFEINQAYGRETEEMLVSMGYGSVRVLKDMFGKDRFVTAIK